MNDIGCHTLQNLTGDLFRAYDEYQLTFGLSEEVHGTFPFSVSFTEAMHWHQGEVTVAGRTFVVEGGNFLDCLKDAPEMDPYPMTMRLVTPRKTYEEVLYLPNPWNNR